MTAAASPWDVPLPVLFNAWKHHAGALRCRIAEVGQAGPEALAALPAQLLVMGTELMDLYVGPRLPADIAQQVLAILTAEGKLAPEVYRPWVEEAGGYRTLTFHEDRTVWVLRAADEERYVHLHPGRWTPDTRRVRANVLKTAVLVLAHVAVNGGDPRDVKLVNRLRTEHLDLPPMREILGEQGLDLVLNLLQESPGTQPRTGT
jgi:hypothetical protein